ncbi:chromosome segregation ATPase [Bradyrhizobium sp. USDA 4341]
MPSYLDHMNSMIAAMPDGVAKSALDRVVKMHGDIEATKANVHGNADLSAQGKRKEAQAFMSKRAHEVIRAKRTADRLAIHLNEKRAKIQLPAIDKTDAASAALRGQVRDRLASKSAPELRALIPSMSFLFLQSILEAPELVGVDRATIDAVRDRAIDLVHPGALAELDAERERVRLLANATAALSEAARDIADLPNGAALDNFLNETVPDQRHIEADIERSLAA